jgi:hypothetical protein
MEKYDLSLLTCQDFAARKGENFNIRLSADIVVNSKLVDVTEFKNYSPINRLPFSLIFQTVDTLSGFSQGTYEINHPEMGGMDIFLVPIGPDSEGMRYEAIFS